MKRVLVTGATGFIGRHTLPLLVRKGYEIHAVTSSSNRAGGAPAETIWHKADLLDPLQVRRVVSDVDATHLLHLAWHLTPGEYAQSKSNLAWLKASLDLVEGFAQGRGERVVVAGTCFEYDQRYGYCNEVLTPIKPETLYGTCKHALKQVLEGYVERAGVSAAWGRVFYVYGPYEHPQRLVSSVVRSLLAGEIARCSPGTQIRDFMYVEDVALALVTLLDSEVEGAVNIGTGEMIAIKDLIGMIVSEFDSSARVDLGALSARPGEPHLLVGDMTRLYREVGYSRQFQHDQAIKKTIAWWRSELSLTDQTKE